MLSGVAFAPHPPVMVPAVGKGRENEAPATQRGFAEVAAFVARQRPDVIVCLSPHGSTDFGSIGVFVDDRFEYSFAGFGAPGATVSVPIALDVSGELLFELGERRVSAQVVSGPSRDHGAAVPLHFVLSALQAPARLVLLEPGGMSEGALRQCGQAIRAVATRYDGRVLLLASGDLSHYLKADGPYGLRAEGAVHDAAVEQALANDPRSYLEIDPGLIDAAGQCAHEPFAIALHVAGDDAAAAQVYSSEGPFGVGYLCAGMELSVGNAPDGLDEYATLARLAVAHAVCTRDVASPDLFERWRTPRSGNRAGAFVTLEQGGNLRGCIGTILPTKDTVADEICYCAHQAALADPRFLPVAPHELPSLRVKTDVLGEIEDINGMDELDVHRYGVIVSQGARRGLLLPDLDGVDTVEEQVRIAAQKGGISGHHKLQRFEVVRHETYRDEGNDLNK